MKIKAMKEEFLIFEVTSHTVVVSASLSSSGISTEEEWSVLESHIDTVETELEAIQRISELIQVTKAEHFPEFGFTFKRIFTIK